MSAYGLSFDTSTGEYSVNVDVDTAAEQAASNAQANAAQDAADDADEPTATEQIAEVARTYALPIGVALVALLAVAALRSR